MSILKVRMMLYWLKKKNNCRFVMTEFEKNIKGRSSLRYLVGLLVRWKNHFKYDRAVRIARQKGATIGENVVMPLSLA